MECYYFYAYNRIVFDGIYSMLISHRLKLIVMKPPKTGGNTLFRRLQHLDEVSKFRVGMKYLQEIDETIWVGHITLQQFSKFRESEKTTDYRRVCFVRNPLDRVFSAYQTQKETHMSRFDKGDPIRRIINEVDFNRFIRDNVDEDCIRRDVRFCHYRPLHEYTHYQGRNWMDFIGYNEKFEEDFDKLCRLFGLGDVKKVSKNVKTKPKPPCDPYYMQWENYKYLDKYERETVKLINELYAKDFEYFDYRILDPEDFPEVLRPPRLSESVSRQHR